MNTIVHNRYFHLYLSCWLLHLHCIVTPLFASGWFCFRL